MTAPPLARDRRAERHARTKSEIIEAAWRLAEQHGLAGWSLRDVADAVGMRAPSLYVYFDSKNALYDAMFAQGYRELLAREPELSELPPVAALRDGARYFFDFCVERPARYTLLFLRTLPGFEPSAESYDLATRALDAVAQQLERAGAQMPEALDLWTALITGLASQQVSNDPGGRRWADRLDDALDMFVATQLPKRRRRA